MSRERSIWFNRTFDSGTKKRAETERDQACEVSPGAREVPHDPGASAPASPPSPRSASACQRAFNPETQRYDGPVIR